MFDINTIISQALAAAVAQAIQPLQQEYANKMAEMAEKIAALEKRVFEDLGTIIEQEFTASMAVTDVVGHNTVQALTDRVAFLENQALVMSDAVDKRIAALEDNKQMTAAAFVTYLDNQEWFWGKIREFTGTVVEQAVEHHCDEYDHNDFVTEDKLDDYVKTENLEYAVRDIMEGATVSIRI